MKTEKTSVKSKFTIGSRGSKLALWQAEFIKGKLTGNFPTLEIDIKIIKTTGDKLQSASLSKIGGKGVFTKEIEDALLAEEIDLAVHSLKDLPTTLPGGLHVGAIPPREDARDALVLRPDIKIENASLKDLPQSAIIGTSSLRRVAQLRFLRPDLEIREIRGNVDTRLRKLDEGQFDAIILACAGLKRLGLSERISLALDFSEMLGAVGQGALGIETRIGDAATNHFISTLNDLLTQLSTTAERAFLHALGGGCQVPIAANAFVEAGILHLQGLVANQIGTKILRESLSGKAENAVEIGQNLAGILKDKGANELLSAVSS